MPLPRGLARFNKHFSNKVMRPLALLMPGFGVLRHRGRETGRLYETPVNVFEDGDRLVVALTYGEDVDWRKNAESSTRNEFVIRGRVVPVGEPYEVGTADGMAVVPWPVRVALRALDVTAFVAFPRQE